MTLSGRATPEGTRRYAARFPRLLKAAHFRDLRGLAASSIGLGTYLGEEDEVTDRQYVASVTEALLSGCNVLDSAINYRCQRSERNIGEALARTLDRGAVRRDEVIVATKGGFLPFDGAPPRTARQSAEYVRSTYLDPGIAAAGEIVAGCHVLTPRFIEDQLGRSLANLGLECIDIYYLHNPETQLAETTPGQLMNRVRAVFAALEREVASGRIQYYGVATWDGLRDPPTEGGHLAMEELVALADGIAGERHHFRVVQMPFNLAMPEALLRPSQPVHDELVPALTAASRLALNAMSSASILQGQLASGLPAGLAQRLGQRTDAQRSIQFVRSAPGIGTALVGMRSAEHVRENLEVAATAPLPGADIRAMLRRTG